MCVTPLPLGWQKQVCAPVLPTSDFFFARGVQLTRGLPVRVVEVMPIFQKRKLRFREVPLSARGDMARKGSDVSLGRPTPEPLWGPLLAPDWLF